MKELDGLLGHGDINRCIHARKPIDILAKMCDTLWALVARQQQVRVNSYLSYTYYICISFIITC